jgi:hypothetical protein
MNEHPRRPLHDGPAAGDEFDRRLRLHYWQATTQLSARTQAQLQQRLRAAMASHATSPRSAFRRSRRIAWSLAAACSLVVAFGVGERWQAPGAAGPPPSMIASSASGNDQLVATLDETPDLYLWVASGDATAMTSE